MLIAMKTYDCSTLRGRLDCVGDQLQMPADNLNLSLRMTRRQVTDLNVELAAALANPDLEAEKRAELLRQLQDANRAMQLIEQALDSLEGAKYLGENLVPKSHDELPPAPPLVRQTPGSARG